MKDDQLDQLLRLRKRRMDTALERLVICEAALREARRRVTEAAKVLAAYQMQAREQEIQGLSALLGRTVALLEIEDFRSELAVLGDKLKALQSEEEHAQERQQVAQKELSAATEAFRKLHRRVEKLQYLAETINHRSRGKQLAAVEAMDDDQRGRPSPLVSQGRARPQRI